MKIFDHFELDSNNNRILACGIDERGEAHKTPILFLSEIHTKGNHVIVFDDGKPMFLFEASNEHEVIQKKQELTAFIKKNGRNSPSCFKP